MIAFIVLTFSACIDEGTRGGSTVCGEGITVVRTVVRDSFIQPVSTDSYHQHFKCPPEYFEVM